MNSMTLECANEICNCSVQTVIDSEAYCSDSCQNLSVGEEPEACPCGHPQCDTTP